jgi:hypothetical protein
MTGIKGKPNVDDFLNGGDAVAAGIKPLTIATTTATAKRSKLVQLPSKLLDDLKMRAFSDGRKTRKHVTETAVIEAALMAYLYK